MRQIETDIAVIGAGPAGLSAAYQAAAAGAKVTLIDENKRPGGQLFKQIHKFFGSREHHAGVRGYLIGEELLTQVKESGADVMLDSLVYGLLPDKSVGVIHEGLNYSVKAKKIIIASGAKENYMAFPGSTLPGVMGAGAAQTMINVNRVLPGKRILMVGSGNVGLIVSYHAGRGRGCGSGGRRAEDRRLWRTCRQASKSRRADLCEPHDQAGLWKRRGGGCADCSPG